MSDSNRTTDGLSTTDVRRQSDERQVTDGVTTRPTHLGHVHLKVSDLTRALTFYTEVLGLDVEERYAGFVFLTFGHHHHDVALQELGADASGPGQGVGLYHAAFEVETATALASVFERLEARGISATPVDHRISKALYFDDPDGNGIEVYLDTRTETGHERWNGTNQRFDPTTL